jgi:hypothetical protein
MSEPTQVDPASIFLPPTQPLDITAWLHSPTGEPA